MYKSNQIKSADQQVGERRERGARREGEENDRSLRSLRSPAGRPWLVEPWKRLESVALPAVVHLCYVQLP